MADIDENIEAQENTEQEKEQVKYFSRANVVYLLTQVTERLKGSHIGE